MGRRAAELHATDGELLVSAPLTFDEFFLDECDHLFGTLCLIVGDREEAEELAQDAFVKVWERWDRVQEMDNPVGYLHRIAVNGVRRRFRRESMLRRITPRLVERPAEASAETPALLHDALRALSPRQRAALVLTEFWGYTAEEAGKALGVKPSTIGALKHQGRASLRRSDDD
jgi:RNA polymerase sigma-70 factor (ECF subfamily)